ncbi:Endonuclease/exonuclease/phosphatase [Chaetomium sp. MPI-SDFR-AT-0129]|nr:Endonuclease/exonuclease/phosphatase [Chaetomium sp. MPI-SDFR-AT-0129]
MAPPPTLDLFMLTFNCAKNFIDPPVFAAHLYGALEGQQRNATATSAVGSAGGQDGTAGGSLLPDLVVFSLQEVAPMSYSFIGSYFLNPYYARFGEALNLASAKLLRGGAQNRDDEADGVPPAAENGDSLAGTTKTTGSTSSPYTLVRANNVGMTAIVMYARDPASVVQVEDGECGFGAADMGNKGAVGLRATWSGHGNKTTELTFVAAHFAAMEWNLKKRNANWRAIVSGMTFSNPRSVLPGVFPAYTGPPTLDRTGAGPAPVSLPTGESPEPSEEEQEEDEDDTDQDDAQPLLSQTDPATSANQTHPQTLAALHNLSVYKPTSYLFVAGDLNYRIDSSTPPPNSTFPSPDEADHSAPDHYAHFLPRDQLTRERRANRVLHGLSEAEIAFGPTYKFDLLSPGEEGAANQEEVARAAAANNGRRDENGIPEQPEVIPWRFAPHRWPSWCDRILYLDVPAWVSGAATADGNNKSQARIDVSAYNAFPVLATSDHRPVFFRATVPLLGADEMRPPPDALSSATTASSSSPPLEDSTSTKPTLIDPRLRLPVAVDVHAWERRAAARRKELVMGWTAFVWSTREGAMVLATALLLGVGGWWLVQVR